MSLPGMKPDQIKLTDPTDEAINAAVAEHVAGWNYDAANDLWRKPDGTANVNHRGFFVDPAFTRSADAVLPLLEKWKYTFPASDENVSVTMSRGIWLVVLPSASWDDSGFYGEAPTFPLAACIALLRAKGIQVEFTKEARQ